MYFVTRSTAIEALRAGEFSTSSVAYEAALIGALKSIDKVAIVNIGGVAKRETCIFDDGFKYISMGFGRTHASIRALFYLASITRLEKRPAVLVTGYYPLEMVILLLLRLVGWRVFSIIYDSHVSSLAGMSFLKRFCVNLYFRSGLFCAGFLSGVIVINRNLIGRFPVAPRRVLLSRIGSLFHCRGTKPVPRKLHEMPRLLFAGTLNSENGVDLLLGAFAQFPELKATIAFYGDGEARQRVIAASEKDMRISFQGRVSDKDLDIELLMSDFLICLRDPDSISAIYAFPSKLIKFMGSGVPVLVNRFSGIDGEMQNFLFMIDGFDVEELAAGISRAAATISAGEIGLRAKQYIEENHRWSDVAQEMVDFIYH